MTTPSAPAPRAARLAVEIAPIAITLGVLMWQVRSVLSPLVAYALLWVLLWPRRREPLASRTLTAMGLLVTVWFLWANGGLLAPFLLALGIAYLLSPAVEALERRRVPRAVSVGVVLLPFLIILLLLPLLLLPALERQLVQLADRIPTAAQRLADWALARRTWLLERQGGLLSSEQVQWLRDLDASDLVALVTQNWERIGRRLWSAFLGIGHGVNVALTLFGYLVITPVVTFYVLKAWPRFVARTREAIPPARRDDVLAFTTQYDASLGKYIRGQLTEATIVGVLTATALAVLGFPGALLVGVMAGVFNLVPYVGLWISLIPGLFLALISPDVLANLLKLGGVFAVVQFIDGSVTGPRIVGESVGLDPVWVMVALALFGSLLGFVGLILAVPLAVLVKMVAARAWLRYKESTLYAGATGGAD